MMNRITQIENTSASTTIASADAEPRVRWRVAERIVSRPTEGKSFIRITGVLPFSSALLIARTLGGALTGSWRTFAGYDRNVAPDSRLCERNALGFAGKRLHCHMPRFGCNTR